MPDKVKSRVPSFTTRVELHSANYDDYETLHSAMEDEGFSRFIRSGEGAVYHLPTAEYDRTGQITIDQVLKSAVKAATRTGRKHMVLVTEAVRRSWIGLPKVK